MKTKAAVLSLGVLMLTGVAYAASLTYTVGPWPQRVSFTSNAPAEIIKGETNSVTGQIQIDDTLKVDAKHPAKIEFNVDLKSLKTGIELRDEHMRDRFLETGKYPSATFKATQLKWIQQPDLKKGGSYDLKATGDFTLHGVTVKKTIPLKATFSPTAGKQPKNVRVQGEFRVLLAEHNIQRPQMVMVKLADTIIVNVDLNATPTAVKK